MSNEYPEYIVYHLDYSKKRKEPIKRNIKGTNNESQAWELLDSIEDSEMVGSTGSLKKGWNEYSVMDIRESQLL
ncbi:MAG: hypothetical protein ACXADW_16160 [Candidatus Hodarchaeales archaeon]